MYISLKELVGLKILATDGEIGKSDDFYFDDVGWNLRYIIVDTGNFLSGQLVLISHFAFKQPSVDANNFPINLSKSKIKNSPPITNKIPVSKRMENELAVYYQWPFYWHNITPITEEESTLLKNMWPKEKIEDRNKKQSKLDPNLRSFAEVKGYTIAAMDDTFGQIDDFLVDNNTWKIRYLVIDTRKWWPGGKDVLISPAWIDKVKWGDRAVQVNLESDVIQASPEYDKNKPITKELEIKIFKHYGKHKERINKEQNNN